MSSKILTQSVVAIDTFISNPLSVLKDTEDGAIAVFSENVPMFYAITPSRLAQLLALEARLTRPKSDIALDTQLFEEHVVPVNIPMGKFMMYNSWHPDEDFQRQAALWGISLTHPVTPEELSAFITWWQSEGKVFTHIQWQQKLARSMKMNRANKSTQRKRNTTFSKPDTEIPSGFRGAK